MNVLQDGIHEVTDTVLIKARARSRPIRVWVSPFGCVTLAPADREWRRGAPPPDADLVGTFNRQAPAKLIRESLEIRVAEIRA